MNRSITVDLVQYYLGRCEMKYMCNEENNYSFIQKLE